MGRTKTKIMDDSQSAEPEAKKPGKKLGRQVFDSEEGARRAQTRRDELVEKLKAELNAQETTKSSEESLTNVSPKQVGRSFADAQDDKKEKPKKQGKAKPRSKKYQEKVSNLDKSKSYPLTEAVELAKKLSYTKFEGTLEAHINTVQTNMRGLVSLPFASGKKLTILAFGKDADKSGADIVGSDEVIENISKGQVNFDILITTPQWMSKLAKVAKILGPKGLMPNPKNGTITDLSADGLKKAVEGFLGGKTEYKTEAKAKVIHISLGKLNQPTEELSSNITTILQTLGKTKVKKVVLSPTMGPSVKLNLSSF